MRLFRYERQAVEPPIACNCQPARELAPDETIGARALSSITKQLERSWSSDLRWRSQGWLRPQMLNTRVQIRLSGLRAYESRCDSRAEPAQCGGGTYLEGALELRTEDKQLAVSAPVRMQYGPPAAIKLELHPSVFAQATLAQTPQRLVLSLYPEASAPGTLSAYGKGNGGSDAAWSELASWR